jgi:hypothetical protein
MEAQYGADEVHDGVHGTDFVEVDLFEGGAVDVGLDGSNAAEGLDGTITHLWGKWGVLNQAGDLCKSPVVVGVLVC